MFMQLNDERARKDVRRGYAARVLPKEVYDWLYPQGYALGCAADGRAAPEQRIRRHHMCSRYVM